MGIGRGQVAILAKRLEGIGALAFACQQALSADGRLTHSIPDFIARQPQVELASAIAKALDNKSILVAEAGTGTGKTFAYLLPCLLSGKKTLISTATKTLQDQLFQKDLPTLLKALGLSLRVQNLKGRSNYICQYRVNLYASEGHFQTPKQTTDILQVQSKLSQMKSGDRSELPEIKEDSNLWYYITSTSDNCLGAECPQYDSCFLVKARKRAMTADLIVINHHLFFADSRLKEEGLGELLPGVEAVIFDEAHQLMDIATHFYGERVGTRQLEDLLDDTVVEWPVLDLANQPLKSFPHKLSQLTDALLLSLTTKEDKISWEELQHHKPFLQALDNWLQMKEELMQCLVQENIAEIPALILCKERLQEFEKLIQSFMQPQSTSIRWVERFKQSLVFHTTPFTIDKTFHTLLQQYPSAYVFTSATLTTNASFDWFCKTLGLTEAETLTLTSPFNFQEQALMYLPRSLPDPKSPDYYSALIARVKPVIQACGGRCFFLFTSHKALKLVAQMLSNTLDFPLLIQGEESKPILLARFRQLGNAVLLGTSTFWEGVDVKGEALSCVIIDKLPFASPADPVVRGRIHYIEEQGLSGFNNLSLPEAVIALKQGVGRLIRDVSDKGILMIADPRLTTREYGRTILGSLPPMPKTRDEQKVLHFIKELALTHETVSL